MRKKVIIATAIINGAIFILSLYAAVNTEHVYFSIAASLYSIIWLLLFIRANFFENEKPAVGAADNPTKLGNYIKQIIAKVKRYENVFLR